MKIFRNGSLMARYGLIIVLVTVLTMICIQLRVLLDLGTSKFIVYDHSDETFNFTKIEYHLRTKPKLRVRKPSVLILSTIATMGSYGVNRGFGDFLETLNTIVVDELAVSFTFLFSSQTEFDEVNKNFVKNFSRLLGPAVEKVTLMNAPFIEKTGGFSRKDRQKHSVQRQRRRLIARSRNFAILNSLANEQYTLSVDADIHTFDNPTTFLTNFINSGKDIIVPRVVKTNNVDYDLNSWRGERTTPNEEQLKLMDENKWDKVDYIPRDVRGKMYHFRNYVNNDDNEKELHKNEITYAFNLDSVGGAVLFVKSIVYKQGAIFPTSFIIGTNWKRQEGYDGIETEGLCYLAKPLGYYCWGMPNMVAHHAND